MADPRHEYITGKVRGFNTRVAAFDASFDEHVGRFASAPVADASPRAFPARFRPKSVFPSFRANARGAASTEKRTSVPARFRD